MAGGYNAPGLPEIKGTLPHSASTAGGSPNTTAGALRWITQISYALSGVSGSGAADIQLNASSSNAIYGASNTVMPPSINLPVILYLGRPR